MDREKYVTSEKRKRRRKEACEYPSAKTLLISPKEKKVPDQKEEGGRNIDGVDSE